MSSTSSSHYLSGRGTSDACQRGARLSPEWIPPGRHSIELWGFFGMERLNSGALREAVVQTRCDICRMCGCPITPTDRDTFGEAQRCRRCHDELDTASGPIPTLTFAENVPKRIRELS